MRMNRPCDGKRPFNTIRLAVVLILGFIVLLQSRIALADTPIALFESFAGNVNYLGTQRTLRTQPNSGNACSVVSSATTTTAALSGIPATATVLKAYLYWAGSGAPDYNVTFEGSAITASRQYTSDSTGYSYFNGVADVTAAVAAKRNGTYSFSGLTVSTSSTYCDVEGVLGGWVILVVYSEPSETFRVLNIYEGFQPYQYSSITLNVSNFEIPTPLGTATGRHGHITWEGDPTLSGGGEDLTFNGVTLTDGMNPTGNQFNSASNINAQTNSHGVDFDAYTLTAPVIQAGQTTASTIYSSGQDLVLLSAEIIAVPNIPVADLSVGVTLNDLLIRGQNSTYTVNVANNGPNNEPGPIVVTTALPAGLGFVSGSGSGWSCTAAGLNVSCSYGGGGLANGAAAPPMTLTVSVAATASGTISNTVTVDGASFDNIAGNDTATASATVSSADLAISKIRSNPLVRGQNATYILSVTNNGPITETGPITVIDTLPADLSFVSAAGSEWTCSAAGQTVTCTRSGSLASGASSGILLTALVDAAAAGTLINDATVAGYQYDSNLANNSASDSYTVLPTAYAYYTMDEATWTGGVVPDSSGLGHNGTVLGSAAPTGYPPASPPSSAIPGNPGTCGAGRVPSGTTHGVNTGIDVNASLGNAGSISFWFNSSSAWNDGTDRMLFDASNNLGSSGNTDKHFYLVKRSDGRLLFAVEDNSDTNSTAETPAFTFAANTWHHIAAIWNLGADRVYIYVDGNLAATATTNVSGTLANTTTLYLGARRQTGITGTPAAYTPNSANGYFDEVYFYSGALGAAQVVQLRDNTHSCGTLVSHYAISYPLGSTGVTCEAMAVRVTAHDASHTAVAPPGATQITLSTLPSTDGWAIKSGVGVFVAPNKYVFSGNENHAEFWLTRLTPTAAPHIDIDVTDGSKTDLDGNATEDVKAQFADTGFLISDSNGNSITINHQIAGKLSNVAPNEQSLFLRAVKKSDNSKACVAALQGTTPVKWAYECIDPSACQSSNQLTLNAAASSGIVGNNSGNVLGYTDVNMAFDANGYAPFSFKYADVGRLKLHAHKSLPANIGTPPSAAATLISVSNDFVVKPARFALTNIASTATPSTTNPAATDQNGGKFVKAGEAFTIKVTAVNTDGFPTPAYGKEATPESVKLTHALVQPSGGVAGTFSGTFSAFTNGEATGTAFRWDEVGIISLTPSVVDGNYLGAGDVSGTAADYVGRFYPDRFAVTDAALVNRSALACSPVSTFSYMGEGMSLTQVLTAKNVAGGTTQNYAGVFAKIDGTDATKWTLVGNGGIGLGGVNGPTELTSRLGIIGTPSATWLAGAATFAAQVMLNRAAAPDGPFDALTLGIAPRDTDEVTLPASDLNLDADLSGSPERRQVASTMVRYGRVRLNNAHGSEMLALPVPVRVEYFNGNAGFVTNTADNCTTFALIPQTNNTPTSFTHGDLLISNPQVNMTVGASVPAFAPVPVLGGSSTIRLSAPGAGKNGSIDLRLTVPDYLQFPWAGGNFNPAARATFGVFKGNNQFIYMRENY